MSRFGEPGLTRPVQAILEGHACGRRLNIGFSGTELGEYYTIKYLQQCLEAESITRMSDDGNALGADEFEAFDRHVDLTFTQIAREETASPQGSIIMPMRVHMVVSLAGAQPDLAGVVSGEQRRQHRKRVEVHRHRYEITHSVEDFEWFYDRMYVPTMRARHGEAARTTDRSVALHELFGAGHLMLVYAEDLAVAGSVNHVPGPDQVNARLIGVLDGAQERIRQGAVKSAGHFLLAWAHKHGMARVDFQGCEPFLRKGTFQAKLDFGASPVLPPPPLDRVCLRLTVRSDTLAVRDFLAANPIIALAEDGQLGITTFYDDTHPPSGRKGLARPRALPEWHIDLDRFLKEVRPRRG